MRSDVRRRDERLGVTHHAGVEIDQFHQVLNVLKESGVIPGNTEEFGASLSLFLFELFDGAMIHGLTAPNTEVLVARCVALAPRTGQRSMRLMLFFFDICAMRSGDLPIVSLSEHRDIAARHVRAPRPPVVVLDMGLGDVLAGQIRGAALAHPAERYLNMLDTGHAGGPFGHLDLHPRGKIVGFMELRQRG